MKSPFQTLAIQYRLNEDTISEQCIRNDDGLLPVNDDNVK